ncbi:hypothetical protein GALL_197290 [mine drainage metagenome]|uniref:Uncharacterized protein n=1 Tax=mine drainage metagenome TaxID=410659 RepID=A0A1J5S241_9ZZZZ
MLPHFEALDRKMDFQTIRAIRTTRGIHMLDSVIKLTEKITELLQYRNERRARQFKILIEPTYLALKVVHQDYLSIFETARKELASGSPLSTVADLLESRRLEEEAERRAIIEHAKTMRLDKSLADYHSFFDAIIQYFRKTPFSGGSTPSNSFLHSLRDAANSQPLIQTNAPSGRNPRDSLVNATEHSLQMLRKNWEIVSTEYAKVLAASIE